MQWRVYQLPFRDVDKIKNLLVDVWTSLEQSIIDNRRMCLH